MKLSDVNISLLYEIYSYIEYEPFCLFGGVALDCLINLSIDNIKDYDIGIESVDENLIETMEKTLNHKGFRTKRRNYFVGITNEVLILQAKRDNITLDINFLDSFNLIGIFNIESVYWKFPSLKIVDNNGINGIKSCKILLLKDIDRENPYLILSRLIKLLSKYDCCCFKEINNQPITSFINNLNLRLSKWNETKHCKFHESDAKIAHYDNLFDTIMRANNPYKMLNKISVWKLLRVSFPEVHELLNNKTSYIIPFNQISTKCELIDFFISKMPKEIKKSFMSKIELLKMRKNHLLR